MKYLWELEKGYMKNLLDSYPEPRPATTTVVTLLNRMIEKGYGHITSMVTAVNTIP